MDDQPASPLRRDWMRQAACVAGAWAASGQLPALAAGPRAPSHRDDARSLIVDKLGEPIQASRLEPGKAWLFHYPYVASPVFLLALGREVKAADLVTEAGQRYVAPAGVGRAKSIVAFSAICAHKLVYPTAQLSFIGVRRGGQGEPAEVIHCCSDQSRYDPSQGARVIGGPAPQPLAAVLLEWDATRDTLHAVGVQGGELFDAFFSKYAFRLEMELGAKARARVGDRTAAAPAEVYSKQWQRCSA